MKVALVISPILWIRKLRLRLVESLVQGHTLSRSQTQFHGSQRQSLSHRAHFAIQVPHPWKGHSSTVYGA